MGHIRRIVTAKLRESDALFGRCASTKKWLTIVVPNPFFLKRPVCQDCSKQGSWFREKGGSSCFAAETYVIVEVQEVEPALNVFARLG
jgi:hypothetical protein